MIQTIAFYLFAALVVASGTLTILARNPVHSVLWLILAFFNAAGLMILVGAEFIAMLLVIVYVGAVAVLFLFVVMMLDIDFAELRAGFAQYLPFGILLVLVLAAEMIFAIGAWKAGGIDMGARIAPTPSEVPNIEAIGTLIYTRYLYIFEGAGLILLVALVGAIVLTHRTRGGVKTQNVTAQNMRRPEDATRNVKPAVGQGVEL
ncbi:NADH-quinone oxidoreductase subunit J [Rhizorhabdus wittichii]|uniref:NADH-quinone oxidoreductase subunit J n=2 Tax=Rhizorhabdus wittichii TaxID=160791 RepID=A0A9J9HCV5_RHIWR|nr:NADH-quinone oxidoreductase subunit J [Rhizorhabdus wittichii]ABQ69345.1 NADH-ubiquinone/plastoquinone oxidoreductase, chain 6 [Rhizorhabdus wittichii RW1]ARR53828.1 NADH:ubiquinone oxidoreductase subunit J [Rhizorhabdus wittichii DC-6]QTH20254.1 NADH-quinone oxidoreductase subunit J [Rhizorhabdus wittichii]